MSSNSPDFPTRAITRGRPKAAEGEAGRVTVNHPVYRASTILFPSLAEFERGYGKRYADDNYIYARLGTPASNALREAWAELEGGHGAVLTGCGMSAIATALWANLEAGAHLLMTDSVYGPVRGFCDELQRFGVETTYYDPCIGADIAELLRDNTRVIYLESPGSLTLEVQDVPAIAAIANARGITTIADNTWATPLYFRPLDCGVNISVQAATKYVGGHSDCMLGIVTADAAHYDSLRRTAVNAGQFAGADDIALGLRGMRTLALRLARHYETALYLASQLQGMDGVRRVIYPALAGDAGHSLWRRDFSGACGLFSLLLEPRPRAALAAMVDGLRYFGIGVSWGGYESLVMPANPRAIRSATSWQEEGWLLRVHAGLESPEDLLADLAEGLGRLGGF